MNKGIIDSSGRSKVKLYATLILALAYIISSALGNLLAFYPSDASAFWPAAGVGLAGLLVGGGVLWPGIFFGDLIFNVLKYSGDASLLSSSGWLLLDSVGPTLQAVVGAAVISKYLQPNLEGNFVSIVKTYLVGVALCCTISPTLGVSALTLQGVMPSEQFSAFWFSWWVGDTIGVMLFTPVILWLAYNIRNQKTGKYYLVLPHLLLTTAILVYSIVWFQNNEKQNLQRNLIAESNRDLDVFTERVNRDVSIFESVARYLSMSEEIDESSLSAYVSQIQEAEVKSIAWLPRVRDEQQQADVLVPGFDPSSREPFSSALQQARDSNETVLSGAFINNLSNAFTMVFYTPTYSNGFAASGATIAERRENLKGFVLGVIEPLEIMQSIGANSNGRELLYSLIVGGTDGVILLNADDEAALQEELLIESITFPIFGLDVTWSAYSPNNYWIPGTSVESRVFFLILMFIVMIISFLMLNYISRTRLVNEEVGARTRELNSEKAKLRQAMNIAHILSWSMNVKDRVISMDDMAYAFLKTNAEIEDGYQFDLDKWLLRFVHKDDRENLQQMMSGVAWSENPHQNNELEGRLRRRDGSIRHVIFRFNPQYDDTGEVVEVLGTAQDVTQRKEMLLALRASEQYSRKIIEGSHDCIKVHDLDGVILSITDRGMALMDIPDRSLVLNINWITFWDREQDRRAFLKAMEEARAGRTGHFQGFAKTLKGVPKWWDVHITAITDIEGKVVQLMSVSRDVTPERQSKIALENLNATLEQEVYSRTLALANSEKRYRGMFDSNPIPMWLYEQDSLKFTAVNQAAIESYGYTREEFLSMTMADVHPEIIREDPGNPRANATVQDSIRIEGAIHIRKDGSKLYADVTSRELLERGSSLRLVLANDITERIRANTELKKQQDLTRLILENLAEGVIACDSDGELILFNKAARQWHGVDPRNIPATQWSEYYDLYEGDGTTALATENIPLMRAFNGEQVRNAQMSICRKGQNPRFVVASGEPLTGSNGEKVGAVVVMHDITENKLSARDLVQQQELNRLVLENLSEGVLVCDQQGKILLANKAIRAWSNSKNLKKDAVISGDFELYPEAGDVPISEEESPMFKALNGEVQRNVELLIAVKNAKRRHLTISGGPLIDNNGEKLGAVMVLHDITERKEAQRELEESARQLRLANDEVENERATLAERVQTRTAELTSTNEQLLVAKAEAEAASRAKSSFLAVMSHEIRTPMNGIVGMVDVLSHSNLDKEHAMVIKTIKDSAFSLLSIIDDVLDFSKIEASRLELERVPLNLVNVVEGVVDTLSILSFDNGVSLNVYVDPNLPKEIWGDGKRLRQVLMNLIGNAIKFSSGRVGKPGAVKISIEQHSEHVEQYVIKVNDNGIGISAEQIAKLFTSFSQAETSTTRVFGGTGLGLAISKRLVELMDGEISVSSEYGSGSEFSIVLPLHQVNSLELAGGKDFNDFEKLCCVVVEKDDGIYDDLVKYLEHAGAQVRRAGSVTKAVDLSNEISRDLDCVVICHTNLRSPNSASMQALVAAYEGVKFLLLNSGRRRSPRIIAPNLVSMDDAFVRQYDFLHGVAVAAGRASAWGSEMEHQPLQVGKLEVPSVEQARSQDQLILVAEDDKTNQKVITRQLSMLGYAAEIAVDGQQAWEMWQTGRYSCVLTDLHMPKIDGYELSRRIRAAEPKDTRVPILILTANALSGEAENAKNAGVDEYLTKPLQLQILSAALARWMPLHNVDEDVQYTAAGSKLATQQNLDLKILSVAIGGDKAVINEVLAEYLESTLKIREELVSAGIDGKAQIVGTLAHRLKGSSHIVGAIKLGDLCAQLEVASKSADYTAVREFIAKIDSEWEKVLVDIRDAIAA